MVLYCKKNFIIVLFIGLIFKNVVCFADFNDQNNNNSLSIEEIAVMQIEDLMNLTITSASKRPQKINSIPASIFIITRKEIELYGYTSLDEILKNIPGMYMIDDFGPYRMTFGVRGFWSGYPRNLIFMVDGVSQQDSFFNYHLLQYFNVPVEAIDRIEFVRGPMSIVYGEGSFFGSINIITNLNQNSDNIISGSYGSLNTKKLFARVCKNTDEYSFVLNAGYYNTDDQDESLDQMTTKPENLSFYGINESNNTTNKRLEYKSKYFNYSGKFDNFYANASLCVSDLEHYAIAPSFSHGNSYQRTISKISGGYKKELSDKISIDTKITYHNFYFNFDVDFFSNKDSGGTYGSSELYEIDMNYLFKVMPELDLSLNLYYKIVANNEHYINMHDFKLYIEDKILDDITTWAVAAQVDYDLFKNLKFIAGLRLDQMNKYKNKLLRNPGLANELLYYNEYKEDTIELIPRLSAIYKINSKHVLKFLYSKAISRSSFHQMLDQATKQRAPLETEYIETFEINYLSNPFKFLLINASIFKNTLDNLVIRNLDTSDNTFQPYNDNSGKMVTNGAELTIQVDCYNRFKLDLSGTIQDTKEEIINYGEIDAAYSPNLLAYLKMSYDFNNGITTAISANYVDDIKPLRDVTLSNKYDDNRIGEEASGYLTVDFNLRVNDFIQKNHYISFKANNVFNKQYIYPTYINNMDWIDKGTPAKDTTFMLTYGYKY